MNFYQKQQNNKIKDITIAVFLAIGLFHFKHARALLLKSNVPHRIKNVMLTRLTEQIQSIQPKRKPIQGGGTLAESMDRLL